MNAKIITCPVCQWKIKEGGIPVKLDDREVVVCCDECAAKIKTAPQRYLPAGK